MSVSYFLVQSWTNSYVDGPAHALLGTSAVEVPEAKKTAERQKTGTWLAFVIR